MAQKGSLPGLRYTKEDVGHLVEYAALRGINIIVEIDMPGHTYMGPVSFPGLNLTQCGGKTDWWNYANEPPPGSLKLNDAAVSKYVDGLLTEVASLFPGKYFSTGGDEVDLGCYGVKRKSDIDVRGIKPFVGHAHEVLAQQGKTPIVWEEMAIDFPATGRSLQNDTIVESWTTSTNVGKILKSNPNVHLIHAPSDYFYLDCGLAGNWLRGAPGSATSWCPYVPWSKTYEFDPLEGTDVTPNGASRVLGGEATLWSETVDGNVLDGWIWPRAAAASEVFWTGPSFVRHNNHSRGKASTIQRSVTEALPRLHDVRFRMVDRGVAAQPLQPFYCALRPDACFSGPRARA